MNNYQLTMNNEKRQIIFYFLLIFFVVVFDIEISRRKSSLQSMIILAYSFWVIRFVSFNKSSQYSVSAHSLREIFAFTRNSFLLTEYWASLRFAPMEVPERNNCCASVNSCFLSHRYLYRLYTLIANFLLLSSATFIYLLNLRKKGIKGKKNYQLTVNSEQLAMRNEK